MSIFYKMDLILYILASLGISYGWSDTDAAKPFRNIVAKIPYISIPLLCHECSSFWISFALSFIINPFQWYAPPFVSNILSAFIGFFINLIFIRRKMVPFKFE